MEKIIRKYAGILSVPLICILLQSCATAPYVTSEVLERKYENLVLGESRQSVLGEFGVPHYTVIIPRGSDKIEIAGYSLGNFSHTEQVVLFFKNSRFIGAPRSYQEMFRLMHTLQLVEGASFWRLPNEEALDG